jgi:hypothetical protein
MLRGRTGGRPLIDDADLLARVRWMIEPVALRAGAPAAWWPTATKRWRGGEGVAGRTPGRADAGGGPRTRSALRNGTKAVVTSAPNPDY